MAWVWALMLLGLLILLFLAAAYFAKGQTSHRKSYDSWTTMLGPRNGAGPVMDAREQVMHQISSDRSRSQRRKKR